MENTKQALSARIEEVKKMVEAIESELKSVNEPKDGEWYELERYDNVKFLIKAKSKVGRDGNDVNYHILIEDNGDLLIDDWCARFETARKITPEEALPYFKKYFEKQGFKEGSNFKPASLDSYNWYFKEAQMNGHKGCEFCVVNSDAGCLFDNRTNTFATLVEDKVEPLELENFKIIADAEGIEIHYNKGCTIDKFDHSEIEQIYKLSLKAQGK